MNYLRFDHGETLGMLRDTVRDFDGFARRRRLGPWILESRHRS